MWHLLSLDAPTVAALWTWFVARCCGLSLPWIAPTAMFLAVWMLYAADRLLDARPLDDGSTTTDLEERHRFHHHHKQSYLIGIIVVSIILAALLPHIYIAALKLYALLASLLFGYFFLIHIYPANSPPTGNAHRLPKELAVGLFFPAAIFIPTVAREPQLRFHLAPLALLFAAICTLNCLYLYAWEHPETLKHAGTHSSAHWTTRFATRHLPFLTVFIILCAIASAFAFFSVIPVGNLLLVFSCGLSTALLLLLHTQRLRLSAIHLRALADVALLTPLLLMPIARFIHL
jgi:hypothetical protein